MSNRRNPLLLTAVVAGAVAAAAVGVSIAHDRGVRSGHHGDGHHEGVDYGGGRYGRHDGGHGRYHRAYHGKRGDHDAAMRGRRGDREEYRIGRGHGRGGERRLIEQFDRNNDGRVDRAEIDATRRARLAEFDSDRDGRLSLDEYQALWLERFRSRMVDAFQTLDEDGDAQVTEAEFLAPGERLAMRLTQRRGRGAPGQGGMSDPQPATPGAEMTAPDEPVAAPQN